MGPFGQQLRFWRRHRALSQLQLAALAETTPRYVSFLETGRSRPGRELVLRLAECLDVPLRDRNTMLVAAGLSPMFVERTLHDDTIAPYRRAIETILERHEPYPASVLNLFGEVVMTNRASEALWPGMVGIPAEALLDAFLAPGPGRALVQNFSDVGWGMVDRLRQEAARTRHERLLQLSERALRCMNGVPRPDFASEDASPVTPLRLCIHGQLVSCFATVMRFETARDMIVSELRVEQIFPVDDAADAFFRAFRASSSA
jgi:transcriptional regulator with XRE-family HTH domain